MKTELKTLVAAALAFSVLPLVGAGSGVLAAPDANPVKERQKLMRQVGKAMKTSAKMAKGELAYDAAAIASAMKTMNEVAGKFTDLFPEGSDMENSIMDFDRDSDAKPEIWSNKEDFRQKSLALQAASKAAMEVSGDKAAFLAAFGNVGKTCKGCHEKYKADKKE